MSEDTTKNDTDKDSQESEGDTEKSGQKRGTLSLKGSAGRQAKQSLAQQGQQGVAVEVRRRRGSPQHSPAQDKQSDKPDENRESESTEERGRLTESERRARARALETARQQEQEEQKPSPRTQKRDNSQENAQSADTQPQSDSGPQESVQPSMDNITAKPDSSYRKSKDSEPRKRDSEDEESYRSRLNKRSSAKPGSGGGKKRRDNNLTVTQVLNEDYERDRNKSRQKRQKDKDQADQQNSEPPKKIVRDVTIPEAITVQELANRMAERGADVVKTLMNMGVIATINQVIDPDTAELIVEEYGHKVHRVSEADIELGIEGEDDREENKQPRPPTVSIMGHVDHGKTSLLDALRQTDTVTGESGGITQHIGAYQVVLESGAKITFLDTPGHAAFTEMRSRGANVTDVAVIVVAANDSLMPQTIEAINHAKAAGVPMIIAINKIDLPDSDPQKVKQDLLQHEVVLEELGGDTLSVELSAKQHKNLDQLEEAILLQAEMLELKANPDRDAQGTVIESRQVQGRGSVATVLVQRGTLQIADIFVVGMEWGRVRALIDDRGNNARQAIPGQPIEVLGLSGTPEAGDNFIVLQDEARAREISEYRHRKRREQESLVQAGSNTLEQMMERAREGEKQTLPVIIKADVHGSVEAVMSSLQKLTEENEEVATQILHTGVGGITETDVNLAKASNAMIIGFNVRANAQARQLANQEGIEYRYYNVIYNVIDDIKAILSGMLEPEIREDYLGQAEIRQVFKISKVGNIAGCMVKDGKVARGAKVRLLRDDVVIHEGKLKTLKRFKDEVREVQHGMECGMAFENYNDIKEGDIIECYELREEQRSLE
jgi:translation initiation factor IF-2